MSSVRENSSKYQKMWVNKILRLNNLNIGRRTRHKFITTLMANQIRKTMKQFDFHFLTCLEIVT